MGINFPNTPTVGQKYPSPAVAGLPVWAWDGEKWITSPNNIASAANVVFAPAGNISATNVQAAIQEVDTEKVAKAGDTMTGGLVMGGDLEVKKASPNIYVNKTASGQDAGMYGMLNGKARWFLDLGNANAESGSNVGSDLAIYSYNDDGSFKGTAFTINRANSTVTINGALIAPRLYGQGTGYSPNTAVDNAAVVCSGAFGGGITLQDGGWRGSIWAQSGDLCFATSNDTTPDIRLTLANNGSHTLVGNLTASGATITAQTLTATQNIGSNNWLTVGGDLYTGYNTAQNGTLWFGSNTTKYISCDGTNLVFGGMGNVYTNCPVRPPQVITTTEQGFTCGTYGWTGAAYLCSLVQGNPNWGNVVWQAVHFPGAWAGGRIDAGGSQFDFRNGGEAYKNGGAVTWQVTSDARIKDVKAPYQHGLDEVCALNPVIYAFKDNYSSEPPPKEPREVPTPQYNAGAEYVGLLAQDAEIPMPELFKQAKGWIDGEEVPDLRSAEYTPLLFALVNAVKTLKARIEVLEAR